MLELSFLSARDSGEPQQTKSLFRRRGSRFDRHKSLKLSRWLRVRKVTETQQLSENQIAFELKETPNPLVPKLIEGVSPQHLARALRRRAPYVAMAGTGALLYRRW